jgi:hypothetical protein
MGWNWEMQAKINEKQRKIKQLEEELKEAKRPNFSYSWDFGRVSELEKKVEGYELTIKLLNSVTGLTSSDL